MSPADERELGALYLSEAPRLRAFFRRKLGSRELAEDFTAQTFLRLAEAMRKGRRPKLSLVANGLLVDEYRAADRRPQELSLDVEGNKQLPTTRFLPQRLATFHSDLDGAIRALPEPERDAFILTELRGLTTREAAGVLGTSHMTVARRQNAANTLIREEIQ